MKVLGAVCGRVTNAILSPKISFHITYGSIFKHQRRNSSYVVGDERPFRMAVIGSGPAGFYTAYKVINKIENAVVDMYEQLPVPYGLVRFGVAPDHPEVKVGLCLDSTYADSNSPILTKPGP